LVHPSHQEASLTCCHAGACEWFAWHTTLAAEGAVFRLILTYWTDEIPTAACMTMYLAVVFSIHFLPNRWFAEFEWFTAVLKILIMFVILIACIVMVAGGGPTGTTHHAQNYNDLPAFPNGFKVGLVPSAFPQKNFLT
jgi:amino acid transporter